ncbi:universal stress protein [Rhizobium fabae]|uniref:Nucleotide-binding universal stress UspA family protein n=1 Tax=Rhizobium fabae TaxID=573179 RepID=A0A7W6BGJ1_9HYPH|nr:universal stress protein [Rhizobium fabae]MBB3917101.1 nucleotide-binding universal stress UspA family protein [Rhizobium fabae]RUM10610.1 universal stress protein [Rhizobium fabae]
MTFKSILTHFDIDARPDPRLAFALNLADRFDAALACLSAAQPLFMIEPSTGPTSGTKIMHEELEAIEARQRDLHEEIMRHAPFRNHVSWQTKAADPATFVLESARTADLIVLFDVEKGQALDYRRTVNIADVLLAAGRPVLLPSAAKTPLEARTIVIAWKDAKESRRAIVDAMPLLISAEDVVVLSIEESDPVGEKAPADIVRFLTRHAVRARSIIEPRQAGEIGMTIIEAAVRLEADLIVAGAYGHSRFREWAFGGVTHTLLHHNAINRLLSN